MLKKSIIPSLFTSLLFLSVYHGCASAIPTFGTLMPEKGKYQGGARGDFIFDRDFKDFDEAGTSAYHYTASYGFTDWFALDGMIGLGDVVSELTGEKEIRHHFGFSGGYGFRAKLYEKKNHNLNWVAGFQHMSTHPPNEYYAGRQRDIIWDEWQFSTTASLGVWRFTPYCGLKWSFAYLIYKIDHDRHRRLSNGPPVGLVVGTDFKILDYIHLNAEGRFFDETGLNAGFTIKY